MSDDESDNEDAKFVQRIFEFVQDEKQFESSSDESSSSSDDSDSGGNRDIGSPDGSQPGKRRRADDGHDSDVELMLVTEVDGPENSLGGNFKSRRFADSTGTEVNSAENPVTSPEEPNLTEPKSADSYLSEAMSLEPKLQEPKSLEPNLLESKLLGPNSLEPKGLELKLPETKLEEPKPAVPNVPRRKPGPLRRRLKLMCKLNLNNIDVSAVRERKNLGNCTPVGGKSAGVPMTVNFPEETDDENYMLDEKKILDIFQDGDTVGSSSEDNARQLTASRKDISRTSLGNKDLLSPTKRKTSAIQRTKNTSLKETDGDSTENIRDSSAFSCPSVEVEKSSLSEKIVNGPSKQSTPKVSQEIKSNNESKSQNSLPRLSPQKGSKEQREGSSTKPGDDSDFVSKKTSKSPKKTPEKKTDVPKKTENGPVNQKKLLKGLKSRQNIFSPEKKLSTGVAKSNAVKKPKDSLFNVEKYVQKSPKRLNRIPLTPEAIFARSQINTSRLSLSGAKKLLPKDAATGDNDKTARPVVKEPAKKTNEKAQECFLSPTSGKPRPQSRNSGTDENTPSPSCKTSKPNSRKNNSQVSPKKESAIKNENSSERNCDEESGNKLFSRPIRPERNDNIPSRNISQGSRVSSPLSDFATRRNIPAALKVEEDAQKETNGQSERTLAKLGLPNCEEPVYINWNHSNIPSVVNPEGMSLCKELLSFYRKDLGVNEAIVCQLGKLDPLVLSEASESRTSAESPLSRRLSDVQIPSMNLSKDILSEIDCALNAD